MYYIQKAYPKALTLSSRPYFKCQKKPEGMEDRAKFFEAMYRIGADALERPFELRMDPLQTKYCFFHGSWSDRDIVRDYMQTDDCGKYLDTLFQPAKNAFLGLMDHQNFWGGNSSIGGGWIAYGQSQFEAVEKGESKNPFKGNKPVPKKAARAKAMEDFWHHEIMLDPRLVHAETLFGYGADFDDPDRFDVAGYTFDQDKKGLVQNLEWMAAPENAPRFGLMFLYSRLTQHLDPSNSKTFNVATIIAEQIDENPHIDLFKEVEGVCKKLNLRADFGVIGAKSFPVNDKEVKGVIDHVEAVVKDPIIANVDAFKESIPTILYDYKRISNGSWATKKRDEVLAFVAKRNDTTILRSFAGLDPCP